MRIPKWGWWVLSIGFASTVALVALVALVIVGVGGRACPGDERVDPVAVPPGAEVVVGEPLDVQLEAHDRAGVVRVDLLRGRPAGRFAGGGQPGRAAGHVGQPGLDAGHAGAAHPGRARPGRRGEVFTSTPVTVLAVAPTPSPDSVSRRRRTRATPPRSRPRRLRRRRSSRSGPA